MLKNIVLDDLAANFKLIHKEIDKSKNIIITSHENPDGDSIGSTLAMYEYLISKGKTVDIIFHNSIPECYDFMKNIDKIEIYNESLNNKLEKADLILILDVNSKARIREVGERLASLKAIKCMIDHHYNPASIADYYAVNPHASATGELVYQFLSMDSSFELNHTIAENIYIAIMTDTGGFKFQNTNQLAHLIASDLLNYPIKPTVIFETIYNQMPQNILKLLALTYLSTELYIDNKFNIFTVKRADIERLNLSLEDLNGFSETTLQIKGVKVGALITEVPNTNNIKISLRSKDDFNVRDIAAMFGGGGHINAAGAKIDNISAEEVKKILIDKVSEILI